MTWHIWAFVQATSMLTIALSGARNSYDLHVARVSDSRFERLVLLDVPRVDAPTRLQWKVNKVGVPVDELPQQARPCACTSMRAGSIWFVDSAG